MLAGRQEAEKSKKARKQGGRNGREKGAHPQKELC
jgi:hypothetical protein